MKSATARANANIALVKYWGKSNHDLNIPAVPSLSMTLDGLGTTVSLSPSAKGHELIIENRLCSPEDSEWLRLADFLEQLRSLYHFPDYFSVKTSATVPYKAGLASSASFYAALSKAFHHALDLKLSNRELSTLARLGSASAARSIFAGFAGLEVGATHEEAHAFPLFCPLALSMVLCIVDSGPKYLSSREAMKITSGTSVFFPAFQEHATEDFLRAKKALAEGSLPTLGALMEQSTLKMHASMWVAKPSINYLKPKTLELIEAIYALRKSHGPLAFFTMDAGPHVKVLCEKKDASFIATSLKNQCPSIDMCISEPGPGAQLCHE